MNITVAIIVFVDAPFVIISSFLPIARGLFPDDEDEIENYAEKGAPYGGAEGNHYRKEAEPINYNRPGAQSSGGPKFENKTHIKENTDNGNMSDFYSKS